jgi:hypothetical protein
MPRKSNSHGLRTGLKATFALVTWSCTPLVALCHFAPASIFAFVRWVSDQYGTDVSRIDILRAVRPGQSYSTVSYVRPGGEVLLRLVGRSKIESALKAIDAVRKLGVDPADSEPEYWRMVHNRLVVKPPDRFHTYTHSQHNAWLRRRNVSL